MDNRRLHQLKLCSTLEEFAFYLNISKYLISVCLSNPEYKKFTIQKKKGGKRIIHSPDKPLKFVQKKLLNLFEFFYLKKTPKSVYGFIKKDENGVSRNIKNNAALHVGKKHVLNIDIKDFFPTITARMIRNALLDFPGVSFSEEIASIMALLVTNNWTLPVGSPTSPIISNIVFYKTDILIENFSKKIGFVYSRYADDLTFSSNEFISIDNKNEIERILNEAGFQINPKKIRFQSENMSQYVTGIKVNQKLNIDRKYIRNLRAILHDWEQRGFESATNRFTENKNTKDKSLYFIRSMESKILYVEFVKGYNNSLSNKLMKHFSDLRQNLPLEYRI